MQKRLQKFWAHEKGFMREWQKNPAKMVRTQIHRTRFQGTKNINKYKFITITTSISWVCIICKTLANIYMYHSIWFSQPEEKRDYYLPITHEETEGSGRLVKVSEITHKCQSQDLNLVCLTPRPVYLNPKLCHQPAPARSVAYFPGLPTSSALRCITVMTLVNVRSSIRGASLVVQWLRIHLPMQGTWIQALVQEDPTHEATTPVCHNYWACALEPTSHNYWSPRA